MFVEAMPHPLRAANAANAIPKYANKISFLPTGFGASKVSIHLLCYFTGIDSSLARNWL